MEFRRVLFRSDTKEATVEVFPLAVTGQLPQWPEQGQRELRWFPVAEAAKAVDEPDLQSIIAAFRAPPRDPGLFVRTLLRVKDWQHRSEARRVGKESVRKCRSRWMRNPYTKKP